MLRREDSDLRLLICVQTVPLSSDVAVSIIKKIKIAKVTRSKRDRVWPEAATLTFKTARTNLAHVILRRQQMISATSRTTS